MGKVIKAGAADASRLADLYAKGFEKTGFKKYAAPERRGELVTWIETLCKDGKLWFISDDQGPITLGHYEPEKDEVITIVTRDGMERQGHATTLLQQLTSAHPALKVRPVTRGGKALAARCGFSPSKDDESLWVRSEDENVTTSLT